MYIIIIFFLKFCSKMYHRCLNFSFFNQFRDAPRQSYTVSVKLFRSTSFAFRLDLNGTRHPTGYPRSVRASGRAVVVVFQKGHSYRNAYRRRCSSRPNVPYSPVRFSTPSTRDVTPNPTRRPTTRHHKG